MSRDWLCASDIANLARVQHKSAIKILLNMAYTNEVDVKLHEWVDARMRNRKIRLYRKPSISEAERAILLNSCFGIKVVEPALVNANVCTHVLEG
jgi:hypothetical protein